MIFNKRHDRRKLAEIADRLSATDPHLRRAFDQFTARARATKAGVAEVRIALPNLLLALMMVLLGPTLALLAALYHVPVVIAVGAGCVFIGAAMLMLGARTERFAIG